MERSERVGKWVCCPVCGKHLIEKTTGNTRIEGGSFGAWCKKCKRVIEIFGDCKTRVDEPINV